MGHARVAVAPVGEAVEPADDLLASVAVEVLQVEVLFLIAVCLVALLYTIPAAAWAQTAGFPAKPVRCIVPFAPGGGADGIARLIQSPVSNNLGQSLILDNRSGASGVIGSTTVVVGTAQATGGNPAVGTLTPASTATCAIGSKLLSGGAEITQGPGAKGAVAFSRSITTGSNPTGWEAQGIVIVTGMGNVQVTAYAICGS